MGLKILKRDLNRYEKRPDNHPVYEFESMSICEFALLFEENLQENSQH
jgi:hypothetical protein